MSKKQSMARGLGRLGLLGLMGWSLLTVGCDSQREEYKIATIMVAGSPRKSIAYVALVPKDTPDIYPTEYFIIRSTPTCLLLKEMLENDSNVIYSSSIPTRDGKPPDFEKIFKKAHEEYQAARAKKAKK